MNNLFIIDYVSMPIRSEQPSSSLSLRSVQKAAIIAAIVVLLLALGFYAWKAGLVAKKRAEQYQAVFLTNGQVYFGKVRNRNSAFVAVRDIYYLQQRERLQEAQPAEGSVKGSAVKAPAAQPGEPELALVKLGEELHGPTDAMEINRDHILFIEDLKNDGKVVEAIRRYKTGER